MQGLEVLALASRRKRALSALVDFSTLCGFQVFGAYLGGVVATAILSFRHAPSLIIDESVVTGALLGWGFWTVAAFILNYGVLQGLTGSSLGKLAAGTQVVRMSGRPLNFIHSLFRALLSIVFLIPSVAILAVRRGEGPLLLPHDWVSGTSVIVRGKAEANVIALPLPDRKAA